MSARTLGEWTLDELLGEGAFGQVFRAHATSDRKRVAALKVPRDDRGAALLRAEGVAQTRLSDSKHVPRVLGVSKEPPYIAFEYVEGESLRDALHQGPIEPPRAHQVVHGILAALRDAHATGIVHRDLKPENVLLAKDGRVLVTDFGLAAPIEVEQSLADADPIVGSIPYLAPEVREGKQKDARSDLYALGVIVFELLTGSLPGAAELPSSLGPHRDWDAFYKKLVARRDERFANADAASKEVPKPRPVPPPPARAKVDVNALLEKAEAEFLKKDFMAFVTREKKAHARVRGKTYTFDVDAPMGLAILRAVSPTRAQVVRRFTRA